MLRVFLESYGFYRVSGFTISKKRGGFNEKAVCFVYCRHLYIGHG